MNRNPRIAREFSKQQTKARETHRERLKEFYKNPESYEQERLARLAAYKGELPTRKAEETKPVNSPSLPELGWDNAVKLAEKPTKVEKPYRPTVYKYKPLTV